MKGIKAWKERRKKELALRRAEELSLRRAGETTLQYYKRGIRRDFFLILLVLPGLFNVLVWNYGPMYGQIIAFKDYSMKLGILDSPWAKDFGLGHIISLFQHPNFGRILWNTVSLNLLMIIIVPIPGILFSLFLNEIKLQYFKRTVQTISFFPHFLSAVAVVSIFTLMLSPSTGLVNKIIEFFGGDAVYFLQDPKWFRTIMVIMSIWQHIGWDAIIWLARIATVDPGMYEAAAIDGASRWQRMFYITLPAFKEWYIIGIILGFGSLITTSGFDKIYLLYNPGNPALAQTAETLDMYIFQRGLYYGDYSYAAAVGLFNSLISMVLIFTANHFAKKATDQSLFG